MPTYGYRCENGHEFEVSQAITDAPMEQCPECGSALRRIFYPVGIVFKGQGFYKTDNRGAGSGDTAKKSHDKAGSDTKTESKPEPKKPDSNQPEAKAS